MGSRGLSLRAGVIDSGYRGEWFVPVSNLNDVPLVLCCARVFEKWKDHPGMLVMSAERAIAQAVLLPVPKAQVVEVRFAEIVEMESERGEGSLGSSGA